jgi:hypothetical protein
VVAAPGPSLTPAVAERCRGWPTIAVQDAYRRLPWADVLYACDTLWWDLHRGCPDFAGEKWSTHDGGSNQKLATADRYGLHLVNGKAAEGFSTDPALIHYGANSGFVGINLAMLFGASPIVLVGFNMQGSHFFGPHPSPLNNVDPIRYVPFFDRAARQLPAGVTILNATPDSALQCFLKVSLDDALPDPAGRRPARQLAAAD